MFKYKEYDPKTFSKRRRRLGITQQDMCDIIGCSRKTLWSVETGNGSTVMLETFIGYTLDKLEALTTS